ncbi:MAG: hypothetical protein ACRDJU_00220 [Actinomycetota bacterium]
MSENKLPEGQKARAVVPEGQVPGDLEQALGPKSQAVMNGPQYTMRDKAKEPSEVDLPSPHEDA